MAEPSVDGARDFRLRQSERLFLRTIALSTVGFVLAVPPVFWLARELRLGIGGIQAAFWALILAFYGIGPFLTRFRHKVRVGAEGVYVTGAGVTRFLPYADMHEPEVRLSSVWVHGTQGASEELRVLDPVELSDAITAARAAYLASEAEPLPPELDPADPDLEALGERLRAAADKASYREGGLAPVLARVAADPHAPPRARVVAARAAASADPSMKPRLRETARAAADPDLEKALHRAADGRLHARATERAERRAGRG